MKNLLRLLLFLTVAGFIFTSCEGPMGPAGKNANDVCLTCHNTANFDAKEAEYMLSKHYYGTTSARNGKYCARCHTNEGFKEITGNGKFIVANDIPIATRISCQTCHKHTTFEFPEDTVSAILRTTTPVSLNYYNNTKSVDFGAIDNLCCTCHQIRGVSSVATSLPFFPLSNANEGTTVQYRQGQSFAVHDGNQSNLFAGINGYEFAGKTYTRTWKHSGLACTDCHMNEYNPDTKTGGHTMKPNEDKCLECHKSEKIELVQTAITAKIAELGEALVAKKIFKKTTNSSGVVSYSAEATHDYLGALYATTQTTTLYTSISGSNTVSPATGLVVYGTTTSTAVDNDWANRKGSEWKYGELGAAYNYGFINSELSFGVHNPTYALQILQYSIDYLKSY
jgi:hypothetical protein